MRGPQQAGLAFIFLLGFIIVISEILRTVKSLGQSTFSEVAVYDIAENFVAIVVSSVSTYRSLVTIRRRRHRNDHRYAHLKSSGKSKSEDSHQLQPIKEGSKVSVSGETAAAYGKTRMGMPERAHGGVE